MKNRVFVIGLFFLISTGCVGLSSKGLFGSGVSIAFDPRSLGTQIDDSVMQKNLSTRMILRDKSYLLSISTNVLDGRIFLTGKVDDPEEKLQLTKLAWETKGVRSVKNDIKINYYKEIKHYDKPLNWPSVEKTLKDLLINFETRKKHVKNT